MVFGYRLVCGSPNQTTKGEETPHMDLQGYRCCCKTMGSHQEKYSQLKTTALRLRLFVAWRQSETLAGIPEWCQQRSKEGRNLSYGT